jgi:WXG100 family type VII secretion target
MPRIRLDPSDFHASVADLHRACDDISIAREEARAKVGQLLDGGWSGAAADAFAQGWADWLRAARVVEEELGATAVALAHVKASVGVADADAASSLAALEDRLR